MGGQVIVVVERKKVEMKLLGVITTDDELVREIFQMEDGNIFIKGESDIHMRMDFDDDGNIDWLEWNGGPYIYTGEDFHGLGKVESITTEDTGVILKVNNK